jgi:Tfp pilus assembly protein PilF/peroxiredoxin
VSQSPLEETGSKRYSDGWRAVNILIREGSSWSGRERNVVYRNLGEGGFRDEAFVTGLDFSGDGRAVAAFDYDRDGDLDLALKFRTAPQLRILRNDAVSGNTITLSLGEAVGARATLVTDQRKLVREVRSGSGFYSQPSRTLHFALAEGERAERLEVRWPDGETQTFDAPGFGEYALGRGMDAPVRRERTMPKPAPAVANEAVPPGEEGIWLLNPIPAPDFDLETTGERVTLSGLRGKQVLVNFWATWCPPCRAELADLTAHAADFRAAGVAVLPVSVDEPHDQGKVRAFAAEAGLPFPALFADDATVTAYTVLHRYLTNYRRDMAIPTSYLLDEQGRVIKVYRGAAEAATILADAKAGAGPAQPFAGRWIEGAPSRGFLAMATEMAARGQSAPARTLFEAALAQGEAGADLYNNLAGLLHDEGDIERASDMLVKSLEIDRGQVDARINLGSILLEQGDLTGALALFVEAGRMRPDDPLIHQQLGAAYFFLNQYGNAEEAYREAVRLDPEKAEPHASLGSVLGAQGRLDEALKEFEAARDLGQSTAQLFTNLGVLYMQLGRPEQGLPAFEQAAAADASDYGARVNLAMYYLQEEDAPAARKWLAEARTIDGSQPEAPYLEAQLLSLEGKDAEAKALLESVLSANPDFEPARELLKELAP